MHFNSKKNTTIVILLLIAFNFAFSQTDDVILKAMKTEIDRSLKEFKRDSLARPFFINMYSDEKDLEYSYLTSFGKENKEELNQRKSVNANSMVLVGNYHRTQDFNGNTGGFSLPLDSNERAIRTSIWMNLDRMYKSAARNYVDKMAWLKQENNSKEELALDDFEKREPTILIKDISKENYNFKPIKNLSLKISKLLTDRVKQEKLIVEGLTTTFRFSRNISRYYDTEGSTYRYPELNGTFNIRLNGVNEKGVDVFAYRAFRMNSLNSFPDYSELENAVKEIIEEYKVKFTTEDQDDPYMGPLLIVDGQVESVVNQIVNSLYTSPKTKFSNGNHYQNLPGVRIISKQLSLRVNYGENAQKLKGVKRDLSPIDIQAVIPPDSLQLIQDGILKNMLTSRQPVKKFPQSNGNVKNRQINGVITFTGNQSYSYEDLKKLLIDEARLQGLEYAYIINSDGKLHRKVNVETGVEMPFSSNFNFGQTMKTMRRVLGVENQMTTSTDGTLRYPKSILLEDAELIVYKSNNRLKKDFVPRPEL